MTASFDDAPGVRLLLERPLSRTLAAVALLDLGCIIDNPNHCANRDGDQSCAGESAFCSQCTAVNGGCVEGRPGPDCHVSQGLKDASSGSSTSSDRGDSTSGAPVCTAECTSDTPYCIEGSCVGCEAAGGHGYCASIDEAKPACFSDVCRPCAPGDDATCTSSGAYCNEGFTCGGCTQHSQCGGSACNLHTGTCIPQDRVFHVGGSSCSLSGPGTVEQPFCHLADALAQIGEGQQGAISVGSPVLAEQWDLVLSGQKTVAIIGMGTAPSEFRESSLKVVNGARVYFQNVVFEGGQGLWCDTASMRLHDVTITGSQVDGLYAADCDVALRNTVITGSRGHGINCISTSHPLLVTNSIIARNGIATEQTAGIRLLNCGGEFNYATIVYNDGGGSVGGWRAGLRCEGTQSVAIRNSIVLGRGRHSGDDSMECSVAHVQHSVIDVEQQQATESVVVHAMNPAWFRDFGTLDLRSSDSSPARDRAAWRVGDPLFDLYGEPRPTQEGAPDHAGAAR